MPRLLRILIRLGALVGALVLVWVALTSLRYIEPRYRQVDRLEAPATVTSWTTTGVILGDGRTVRLPNVATITGSPRALATLVAGGLEVRPDGRVVVLVRYVQGCGRSRRFSDRRGLFDLSALLLTLGLATADESIDPDSIFYGHPDPRLDEENPRWPWILGLGGGPSVANVERFCRANKIPVCQHAEAELASLW